MNRAYDFRERCISAQTYFSSAEYKNHIGKARKTAKFSKSKIDLESTLVKMELLASATQDENEVKIGENSNFEGVFKPETYTESEFVSLNEDVIDHLNYDDGQVELLDQSMENTSQNNKSLENIEEELDNLSGDNETVEETKPILPEKVVKSKLDVKNSKKAQPKKKPKGERKNKAKRTYICDQCGNHFKCLTHFQSHLKRHTGVKPVQCE